MKDESVIASHRLERSAAKSKDSGEAISWSWRGLLRFGLDTPDKHGLLDLRSQ